MAVRQPSKDHVSSSVLAWVAAGLLTASLIVAAAVLVPPSGCHEPQAPRAAERDAPSPAIAPAAARIWTVPPTRRSAADAASAEALPERSHGLGVIAPPPPAEALARQQAPPRDEVPSGGGGVAGPRPPGLTGSIQPTRQSDSGE
jgi:hypothetical protein